VVEVPSTGLWHVAAVVDGGFWSSPEGFETEALAEEMAEAFVEALTGLVG
jgi:hypothetical protein